MSESQPLRLSDWGRKPEPAVPPPPQPPPGDPPTAKTAAPGSRPAPATVWNGFDLLRLPTALLRRWYLVLPLALLGALAGGGAALLLLTPKATVTVRLIVRNPQAFAVSEGSYAPSKLQASTLTASLRSPQVAREVRSRLGLNEPTGALLEMVQVAEVKRTEFVDITVTTPWSREKTAEFAGAWAEEAIRFTRRIQSEESVEMKRYLEERIRRNNLELEEVNRRLAEFSEKRNIVNTDKEMDQYLASIADMNVRYEIGRVDLEACEERLTSLRDEIRKHSPTFDDLKKAEIKLQELSEYYTDKNPIYLEEADKVEALRRKVNEELEATSMQASDFTGTFVGNALYLQIIELEAKRDTLKRQNQQIKAMLDEGRAKLKELPAIALEMAPLLESAQVLRASRDVLLKRLQEVEVFENLAPGYYRIFKTPAARDVFVSGRFSKILLLAVVGAAALGVLGLLAAAGLEFLDATVRTAAEASALLGLPATVVLPRPGRPLPEHFAQELWAAVIGPLTAAAPGKTFWQPTPAQQTDLFWQTLLDEAAAGGLRLLVVRLAGDLPGPFAGLPTVACPVTGPAPARGERSVWHLPDAGLEAVPAVAARLQAARARYDDVWLVGAGPVREPAASVARLGGRIVLLVTLNASARTFWATQKSLLVGTRALDGFVALDTRL